MNENEPTEVIYDERLLPWSDGRIWSEATVVREIHLHTETIIHSAYEIGRRLIWTREVLGHGAFGPWCAKTLPMFSVRTLQNYMAVAEFLTRHPKLTEPLAKAGLKKALLLTQVPEEQLDEMLQNGHMAEVPVDQLGELSYVELKQRLRSTEKDLKEVSEKAAKAEGKAEEVTQTLTEMSSVWHSAEESKLCATVHEMHGELDTALEAMLVKLDVMRGRWGTLPAPVRARIIGLLQYMRARADYEELAFRQAIGEEVWGSELTQAFEQPRALGRDFPIPADRVVHLETAQAAKARRQG